MFPEKNHLEKLYLYFERSFSFFLSNLFGMFIKNVSPFTDEGFEKNQFFEQETFHEISSECGKVSYFDNESSTDCRKCVSSLHGNFSGEVRFRKKHKQFDSVFQKSRGFFL